VPLNKDEVPKGSIPLPSAMMPPKVIAIAVYRRLSGATLLEGKAYVEEHGFTDNGKPVTSEYSAAQIQEEWNACVAHMHELFG